MEGQNTGMKVTQVVRNLRDAGNQCGWMEQGGALCEQEAEGREMKCYSRGKSVLVQTTTKRNGWRQRKSH